MNFCPLQIVKDLIVPFLEVFIAFVAAGIAFMSYETSRKAIRLSRQLYFENRVPHLRTVSQEISPDEKTVTFKFKNSGGPLYIHDANWLQGNPTKNSFICDTHINGDSMLIDRPSVNPHYLPYPVYLEPNEHIQLVFRNIRNERIETGTIISYTITFFDLKSGVKKNQEIDGNVALRIVEPSIVKDAPKDS